MNPMFTEMDAAKALYQIRQKWIRPWAPIGEDDLDLLSESSGFRDLHLKEALARAFSPYTKLRLASMVRKGFSTTENPPTLFAILQGRIFALTTSIVFRALSANYRVVLKPSSVEPVFATLFCKSLETIDSPFKDYVDVVLPHEQEKISYFLRHADVCVAYGRDETIREITKIRGDLKTFGFGHKESFIIVLKEALDKIHLDRLAWSIAMDFSIYDQEGCLSPGVVFVEEGGECSLKELCEAIYKWMLDLFEGLPPRKLSLDETTVLSQRALLAYMQAKNSGGLVLKPKNAMFPAVMLVREKPLFSKVGYRTVVLYPFSKNLDLGSLFPTLAGRIQGIAFAGSRNRIKRLISLNPAYKPHYLAEVSFLQRPPANWRENGIDLVEELKKLASARDS
jgi:hypothetical protein